MEAADKPTLPFLLSKFEMLKMILRDISQSDEEAEETKELSDKLLVRFSKLVIHPLWIGAAILHPGFRSLGFLRDINYTPKEIAIDWEEKKENALDVIRIMMGKIKPNSRNSSHNSSNTAPNDRDVSINRNENGKRTLEVGEMMDFTPAKKRREVDELDEYLHFNFSPGMQAQFKDEMGVVHFWISKLNDWPTLSRIALRLMAIPASSCSSERCFSTWNKMLSSDRMSMKFEVKKDILLAKSFFKNMD